jgi:hypothetical protein
MVLSQSASALQVSSDLRWEMLLPQHLHDPCSWHGNDIDTEVVEAAVLEEPIWPESATPRPLAISLT